jgi:hypothetical protein
MDWLSRLEAPANALAVHTAMITPAVLISACGALIALMLGLVGALFMFYGSVLLIIESRLALAAVLSEMDFVAKVSQRHAGKDLTRDDGGPFTWLGRKIG